MRSTGRELRAVLITWIVLAGLVVLASTTDNHNLFGHNPRIAIVGAGAGGSSTALHLRECLGAEADIEVFERASKAGGRVQSLEFGTSHNEVGGAVYHVKNKIFADLVQQGKYRTFVPLQEHTEPSVTAQDLSTMASDLMGVWDGKQWAFMESTSTLANWWHGLSRYGLDSYWVGKEADRVLEMFLRVYDLLEIRSFRRVEDLLDALELRSLTTLSLQQHLEQGGFCSWNNKAFCQEIVTGLTRVNYGQSMDLNALVGLIALIGSTDDVRTVVGGNNQVFQYALWRANAAVHWNSTVTTIAKEGDTYTVLTHIPGRPEDTQRHTGFDKVIVAAPLEFAKVQFENVTISPQALQMRPYQLVHVALVVGQLNLAGYFHTKGDQPQNVITTEGSEPGFTSITLHSHFNDHGHSRFLYKVFSRHPLTDFQLDQWFTNRTETHLTQFHAYPVLRPLPEGQEFPPLILDQEEDVYYVNAMESAFSTIETEMISGKNIARLVCESLGRGTKQ